MVTCDHISLVRLAKEEKVSILDDGRMVRPVQELTWNVKPSLQYPSLQFYIGGNAKNIALQELFPQNNIRRRCHGRKSVTSLHLDTSTITTDQPIFFVESNPSGAKTTHETSYHCHQTASHFCRWTLNQSLFDILHARLFFILADVICIFTDDFGSINIVIDRLKISALIESASSLAIVRTLVIIVASGHSVSPTFDILEMKEVNINCNSNLMELRNSFSAIILIHLAGRDLSPLARQLFLYY